MLDISNDSSQDRTSTRPKRSREKHPGEKSTAGKPSDHKSSDEKSYRAKAAEELREDNKNLYDALQEIRKDSPPTSGMLVDEIIETVNERKRRMEERKYSLPSNIRVATDKIRGHLNSISKAVQVFKDVGSSLASLDPIHAGIPWALVSFILQVSQQLGVLLHLNGR
jgi:hypothetical protein